MGDVGILIVDGDIVSQRALKNLLDAEGWRVRVVPVASQALAELATGKWNLAIVNLALIDEQGPIFGILRDLAQVEPWSESAPGQRRFRVLFLVRAGQAQRALRILEEEGLPYLLQPYHLHDFLEKVSELLVEAGAIEESLRGVGGLSRVRRQKQNRRSSRGGRRDLMFAPREDYQMTEEEMAEFERREEEERKKREKDLKDRGHL